LQPTNDFFRSERQRRLRSVPNRDWRTSALPVTQLGRNT
jgi:hypothetical protein